MIKKLENICPGLKELQDQQEQQIEREYGTEPELE